MAEFYPAFKKMIRNEGGFINHKIPGDRGGQTYAGIARAHFTAIGSVGKSLTMAIWKTQN